MTQPLDLSTSCTSFASLRMSEDYLQGASDSDERSVMRVASSACDKGLSPRASPLNLLILDYSLNENIYLVTTAQVPWRVASPTSFYRDVPGSLEG